MPGIILHAGTSFDPSHGVESGYMESYLAYEHYDLVSPDGQISKIEPQGQGHAIVTISIRQISPVFVGFDIDTEHVHFNLKSTLAQLGIDATTREIVLDRKSRSAEVSVELLAIGRAGHALIGLFESGAYIGKLFAADPKRRVRDPEYLLRMFGRSDRKGRPLLELGGRHGSDELVFETIEGRTVAYLSLLPGRVEYDEELYGLLPTIARALKKNSAVRDILRLHHVWRADAPRVSEGNELLIVKTAPLHVRTVFAKVVGELLPQGFVHTSADVLQPDTAASGDIYELHGHSLHEISDVPLEFYTLEPHREHVFFSDRDQLGHALEKPHRLFKAFETAPPPPDQSAIFVVKGGQLEQLKTSDWIRRESLMQEFPGISQGVRQALMVERYIQKQAAYPFLEAMHRGLITSQGVLLTRYFPTPLLKRSFLAPSVLRCLKGIYFLTPSLRFQEFFSTDDRATLLDLANFAIPVFWVDRDSNQILKYIQRRDKDSGLFVPLDKVQTFLRATFFGIYGSNLAGGIYEEELHMLMQGLEMLRHELTHPQLNTGTPLALVTGGGPGAMQVGNRVAKQLGILSCACILDFRKAVGGSLNEQLQNPYIEAKMTYRREKLVERQAEFHLDFPIFLQGGIGTDFEFALEEVRRKVGTTPVYPVLLFGSPSYWRQKVSSRFRCNLEAGTIRGSEWISNVFHCVTTAGEALAVYRGFFDGSIQVGPEGPIYPDGFVDSTGAGGRSS